MKVLLLAALGLWMVLVEGHYSDVVREFPINNKIFAADLYKETAKSGVHDFAVSPLSTQTILALLHTGAHGHTAYQITNGIHLPERKDEVQEIFRHLSPHLNVSDDYELRNYNMIFLRQEHQVHEDFKNIAYHVFNGDIFHTNFENTEHASDEVNKKVQSCTKNKVQKVVTKEDLVNCSAALLVPLTYFQGQWVKPFDTFSTFEREFHISHDQKCEVDMMQQTDTYKFFENKRLNAKFLELDYRGHEVSMTFVLPNDVDGLHALEAHLPEVLLSPEYDYPLVEVSIPKFSVLTGINLKPILQKLNIVNAFEDYANFNKFLVNQPSKISIIVQGTYIDIQEYGTVATGSEILLAERFSSDGEATKKFDANHPFLYYIKVKDVIVFVGRYTGYDKLPH